MKKIFSFLSLLLMAFAVQAQEVWVLNTEDEGGEPVVPGAYDAEEVTTWFSSPFTDPGEGSIAGLFDGDQSTFWHSNWHNGAASNGVHYLRVDLPEGFWEDNVDAFPGGWGFGFGRRSGAASDHITKMSVWGIPAEKVEAEGETKPTYTKDELDYLGEFEWTFGNNTEWKYSDVISDMSYNAICFFEESTTNNRGYWHLGEFRIYGTVEGEWVDPRVAAIEALQETADGCTEFNDEESRQAWFENHVGTKRGQYDITLANAYAAAYDYAQEILNDWIAQETESQYTLEQINAAKTALTDAKTACYAKTAIAQQLTVAPGYYMIVSSLDFQGTYTVIDYYTKEEAEAWNEEHAEEIETGDVEPVSEGDPYQKEVTGSVIKSIYNNNGNASWKTYEEKAPYLFHIEKGEFKSDAEHRIFPGTDPDNVYKIINMQNGGTFGTITTSAQVKFVEANDSVFAFDIIPDTYVDGNQVINIRNAGTPGETGYRMLHCAGHGGGTGVSGNVVGWTWSAGASQWYLKHVTDEEAEQWLATDENRAQIMLNNASPVVAAVPGQIEIAKDQKATVHEDEPIIESGEQFSSPYTTLDSQSTTVEDIFANLISEEGSTYWHSKWENGAVGADIHYLQVADVDCNNFAVKMTRRNVQNDHITKLRVKGYMENDESLTFEDGTDLGLLTIPFGAKGETTTSSNVIDASGYPVLRFYSEEEVDQNGKVASRGYWHAVKFQMYAAEVGYYHGDAETTQYAHRKDLADAVTNAVNAWNESAWTAAEFAEGQTPEEGRTIDDMKTQYDALMNAYEAWKAVYADPTNLRAAIAGAKSEVDMVVIGNNPGEWQEGSSTLKTAYDNAVAYDLACEFNGQEEMDAYTQAIADGKTADLATANKVVANKWYKLHFASEELYDNTGWDKTGAKATYIKYNDEQEEPAGEGENDPKIALELFGRYVAAGKLIDSYLDENGDAVEVIRHREGEEYMDSSRVYRPRLCVDGETLNEGSNIIFTNEEVGDAGMFRFVTATDSTYYIQNKATGLYLNINSANKVVLSVTPMTFNTQAIGYGASLIYGFYISGEKVNPLHAERATNTLVTWNATALGSNSMLFIEDAETEGDAGSLENVSLKLWPGSLYAYTFPMDVTFDPAQVEVFDAAGFEVVTDDENKKYENTVILANAEGTFVKAGTPVIIRTLDEYPGKRSDLLTEAKAQWVEEEGAETVTRQYQLEKTAEFDNEYYVNVSIAAGNKYISEVPEATSMLVGAFGKVTVPAGTTSVCPAENSVAKATAGVFQAFVAVPTDQIQTGAKYKWNWRVGQVEPAYIVGDANNNGEVEIGDVTSVLTLMATPEAEGYNNKAADANQNGEIEIGDVTTILTIMANGNQ